jgi:hypothetical protein
MSQKDLEFAIRLRKCTNLPSRWHNQALMLSVSDGKADIFNCEAVTVDSVGTLDFLHAKTASFVFSPYKPSMYSVLVNVKSC